MSDAVGGLGVDGKLMVIGASLQPIEVPPLALITSRRSIAGWPSGTSSDSEDTMDFSVLSGIHPMIETYPVGTRDGSLRAHDEQQSAVPRGAHDRRKVIRLQHIPLGDLPHR